MPTRDRKFYIAKHNGLVKETEKEDNGNVINGELINSYANLYQINQKNTQKK